MTFDLQSELPSLLPRAVAWAKARSTEILATGEPLSATDITLATAVGVTRPEKIRVLSVSALPLPEDPELKEVALATGLLGPGMIGMTLGYGIYVCDGHFSKRLISHECRHVHQYEVAGSIEKFLPIYLQQSALHGYHNAPFEADARAHEISSA